MSLQECVLIFGTKLLNFSILVLVLAALSIAALKVFKKNTGYYEFGLAFFLVTNIIVSVYSIVCMKGMTINVFILAISLLLFYRISEKNEEDKKSIFDTKMWIPILVISIIYSFTIFELRNFGVAVFGYKTLLHDIYFYSLVSQKISTQQIENYYHYYNELTNNYNQFTPYHYFELWTNNLLTSIFGGYNALNFHSYTYPLLYFSVLIALLGFLEFFKVNSKWFLLLLFVIPTISGFKISNDGIFYIIGGYFKGLNLGVTLEFKFLYMYIILLYTITLFIQEKITESSSLYVISGFISSIYLPSSFVFSLLIFLYSLWKNGIKNNIASLILGFNVLLTGSYLLFSMSSRSIETSNFSIGQNLIDLFINSNIPIKRFVFSIASLLVFAPLIWIGFKKNKVIFIFYLVLSFFGVFLYSFLFKMTDSDQLLLSLLRPIEFILVFYSFVLFLFEDIKLNYKKTLFLFCFLIIQFFLIYKNMRVYDEYLYEKIASKKELEKIPQNTRVGIFKSFEEMDFSDKKFEPFLKKPILGFMAEEFLIAHNCKPISLSDLHVLDYNGKFRKDYEYLFVKGPLYMHYMANKDKWSKEEALLDFVKKHDIKYIIHKKGTILPESLSNLTKVKHTIDLDFVLSELVL